MMHVQGTDRRQSMKIVVAIDGSPPAALRRSLAELGYVEGRNVVYEGRWAEAKGGRARELVGGCSAHEAECYQ